MAHHSPSAAHWTLDPSITFLNHGSFGACPIPVLDAQSEYRARLEREPVRFMVEDLEPLLDGAREALATFVDAPAEGLAFVPNATAGVNAVLRSLTFEPGDQLLTTSHAYNACANTLRFVAERVGGVGAEVVVVELPVPFVSDDDVVERILACVTPRTRIFLLDHITSPTAAILPAARLIRELDARGIDTLVDGAHAPGMIDLSIRALNPAYYTGNCHKWMCAPKGAGFLFVRADRRDAIHPAIVSHGRNSMRTDRSRFLLEFDWTGTIDPTPSLCIPHAIDFMASLLPGGWPDVRAHNTTLARRARRLLIDRLALTPAAPEPMIGSIASLILPDDDPDAPPPASALYQNHLQLTLVREHHVQVPVIPFPAHPNRLVRVSAQLYNDISDYAHLAEALASLLRLPVS